MRMGQSAQWRLNLAGKWAAEGLKPETLGNLKSVFAGLLNRKRGSREQGQHVESE